MSTQPNAELAAVEADTPNVSAPPKGILGYFASHPPGFWFFFWGEFAERCSYYGMRAILSLYMIDILGFSKANAGTYVTIFIGLCYILPLLGGWIADNLFGKYWTIVGFSIPYVIGQLLVGIEDPVFVFIALGLLAMGSGVIKPNISTLMGLTYDQQRPGDTQLRSDAFSMFYFSINVGAALSQFAMPMLRDNFGYQRAFLFPAALMVLALIIFAAGKKYYAVEQVGKARVIDEEERKMRWVVLLRLLGLFALVMFFWAIFDQAATTWIFFADTYMDCTIFGQEVSADQIQAFNPVFILVLLPMFPILWRFLASRGINVRPTDKMVLGFILTAVTMGIMAIAGYLAGPAEKVVRLLEKRNVVLLPLSVLPESVQRTVKETGSLPEGDFARIFGANSVSLEPSYKTTLAPGTYKIEGGTLTVSVSEVTFTPGGEPADNAPRVTLGVIDYAPRDRVSVWWQVFAYLILTVAEILISVTGLELAFVAAPKSMTSFVTGCWLLTVGIANMLLNIPFTQAYPYMTPSNYFTMLTLTMIVVTVAFLFVAKNFNRNDRPKPAPQANGTA